MRRKVTHRRADEHTLKLPLMIFKSFPIIAVASDELERSLETLKLASPAIPLNSNVHPTQQLLAAFLRVHHGRGQ